jgi:Asp-tRNA(Asn)/Glu-tRNA(Gln) amidotransferase A subunit family amidase
VAARFVFGREADPDQHAAAQEVRDVVVSHLVQLLSGGAVTCLPTVPFPAPERWLSVSAMRELHWRLDALLDSVGLAELPRISVPVDEVAAMPAGLSFIGSRGVDEILIAIMCDIALVLRLNRRHQHEG